MTNIESPERQLARERSHGDAAKSNDVLRSAGQALILINGGAATAILAFAEKASKSLPPTALAVALAIYALGALFGASMIYCVAIGADEWAAYWTARALGYSNKDVRKHEAMGLRWYSRTIAAFIASAACFFVASFTLAVVMGLWGR